MNKTKFFQEKDSWEVVLEGIVHAGKTIFPEGEWRKRRILAGWSGVSNLTIDYQ